MRIRVIVRIMTYDDAHVFQGANDVRVGLEYMLPNPLGYFGCVTTMFIHGAQSRNTSCIAFDLVVFTEAWRHMHNTSSVFCGYKFSTKDLECILRSGKERKYWRVLAANQVATLNGAQNFCTLKFFFI